MLDNSILSVGTIKILKDFNITTPTQLKTEVLPNIGDKPSFYSTRPFKQINLDEINLYLLKLKIDELIGKVIRVTLKGFAGYSFYHVIGFDNDDDVILRTISRTKLTKLPKNEGFFKEVITTDFAPFTVDKLWFDEKKTNRNIEII